MTGSFYDKIAKKFGASGPQAQHSAEYPAGDPEKLFEQKVLELGRKDKNRSGRRLRQRGLYTADCAPFPADYRH
jgi:hypothetical protein